ncbi:hypothetical protein JW859_08355 [bacterium]|nr:hypothetical protein [bacterium]
MSRRLNPLLFLVGLLTYMFITPGSLLAIERINAEDEVEHGYKWHEEIPLDHWAYNAIDYLQDEQGFLPGWPRDYFQPERPLPACVFRWALVSKLKEHNLHEERDDNEQVSSMLDVLRAEFADYLF